MPNLAAPALRTPDPIPPCDKLLLSMDDLARLTDLSLPTIRGLVKDGLPVVKIGTRRLFRRESAEIWFAGRESVATEADDQLAEDGEV